jgi:hypothetical protein
MNGFINLFGTLLLHEVSERLEVGVEHHLVLLQIG